MKEFRDIHRLLLDSHEPLALATLVAVEGASYRRPGAHLLTDGHRVIRGSLSGGCLEGEVMARAREVLADGQPRLLTYDLRGDADLVWGSGMGCEGLLKVRVAKVEPGRPPAWMRDVDEAWGRREGVRLLLPQEAASEPRVVAAADPGVPLVMPPPLALWIWGGDEDSLLLARLAKALGWFVGVADHRPAFVAEARFPEVDARRAGHPEQIIASLPLDARSAVVLLTHNYLKDLESLRLLLERPAGYLGLMGSRARCARLKAELGRADARLHAPVGLDLGSRAPEAVALAILAEIQAALDGGTARPLSEAP
ncbi:MAG TPA: XdhC family protein [Holophagaceae bacterium]|nr:XdhC family protein [Holophagaceae bacterium]